MVASLRQNAGCLRGSPSDATDARNACLPTASSSNNRDSSADLGFPASSGFSISYRSPFARIPVHDGASVCHSATMSNGTLHSWNLEMRHVDGGLPRCGRTASPPALPFEIFPLLLVSCSVEANEE